MAGVLEVRRHQSNKKLIEQGMKSWEIDDDTVVKNLPFMEVDSYFGEFELFNDSLRTWTVIAKTKCVMYTIPKIPFIKLFMVTSRRNKFLRTLRDRLNSFLAAESQTLKAVNLFD